MQMKNGEGDSGVIILPEQDPRKDWLTPLARVGAIGTDMLVFAGIGFWLGQEADAYFALAPWGTFGGLLLGFMIGLWSICKRVSGWRG